MKENATNLRPSLDEAQECIYTVFAVYKTADIIINYRRDSSYLGITLL